MTKDEFITSNCEYSGITREALEGPDSLVVVLPCNCGHALCKGWAIVKNDERIISQHIALFGPFPDRY